LEKARITIKKFENDLTASGFNWDDIKRSGVAAVKRALFNKKLNPYFTLDENGALHWGPALQAASMMSGLVPPQFAVGLQAPPLTSKDSVAALSNWQQDNRKKMEENKRELESLKSELKRLQKDEAEALAESQMLLKDARGKLDALTAQLNKDIKSISDLEKIKEEYDSAEFEMNLHIAIIQQAENNAVKRGNAIFSAMRAAISKAFEKMGKGTSPMESLKEETAKLNKAYKTYANASMAASKAAVRLCDYAGRTSSDSPPSAAKVRNLKEDLNRTIKKVGPIVAGADNEVRLLVKSIETTINKVKEATKGLEGFQRNVYLDWINKLKQIKSNLDNAEKTLPRVRELRGLLTTLLALSNEVKQKLLVSIWETRNKALALAETISEKDAKLKTEITRLAARAVTVYYELYDRRDGIDATGMPEVPVLDPDLTGLKNQLMSIDLWEGNKIFKRLDLEVADGKKSISDAEGAIVAGAFATKNALGELKRARECYASFQNTPAEPAGVGGGDKGDIDKSEIIAKLRQIIKASKDADSLWKNQQVNAKLLKSRELCDKAGSVRQKIPGRADRTETAEKEVNRRLNIAAAIAKKCPDVKNPQNISRMYELARQLTVQIGVEVVMLKKDRTTVAEKISLAEIVRTDARKEAAALKGAIARKSGLAISLWKSISRYEASLSSQPADYPNLFDLFPQGRSAMASLSSLNDSAQTLLNEANQTPQCNVQPADDVVAKAENAYTGVLKSFGARKNLPGEADACLARAPQKDTTPPMLAPLADITVEANSDSGVAVWYPRFIVTDTVDSKPSISCRPPSGSPFLPGSTTSVSCTATDASGNRSKAVSFMVTIRKTPVQPQVAANDCTGENWRPDCDANVTQQSSGATPTQIAQAGQAGEDIQEIPSGISPGTNEEPVPIPADYTGGPALSSPEGLDSGKQDRIVRPNDGSDDWGDEFDPDMALPPTGGRQEQSGPVTGSEPPTGASRPLGGKPTKPPSGASGAVSNFSGRWNSAGTCPPAAAPFRWSISLSQKGANVSGTISFHKCPGGGRVTYSVKGQATKGASVKLSGTRASGRGPLGGSAPRSKTFTVRRNQPPEPNFAPGGGTVGRSSSAPPTAKPAPKPAPPTSKIKCERPDGTRKDTEWCQNLEKYIDYRRSIRRSPPPR